jgi:glycosyltransferase involved in cell wall biosynthesis
MGQSTVSVVIPTQERPHYLRRAIQSVLGQTFGDLELIVVDDGPSDATARLVGSYRDPRVRLVRHDSNRGVAAARNTGIAASSGRYVAFLDDDIWLPPKLERQLQLASERGAEVVHTLVYVADGDGNVFAAPSERGFRLFREVAASGYPYDLLLRRSSFFINTFLVRRECVEAVGGFDEELAALEDLDFVHRLRRRYALHLVDEPLVKHCFHGGNVSNAPTRDWPRLAAKELSRLEEADLPERRRVENTSRCSSRRRRGSTRATAPRFGRRCRPGVSTAP